MITTKTAPKQNAEYIIDVDRLTIRDMLAMQEAQKSGDIQDMMPLFERCLILPEGKTIYELPARHFKPIIEGILRELSGQDLGN